jgi:hypothetical protein
MPPGNRGGRQCTAKAIDYSLKRWAALIRYADSGDLPIDNNPVENTIRPIAIGKKNWLFAGSERAGKRAAAIQSLIGTARLNGLDPAAWLRRPWRSCRLGLLPLRRAVNNRIDETAAVSGSGTAMTETLSMVAPLLPPTML